MRDRSVALSRVLGAVERIASIALCAIALLLLAKFPLELYWAQQERRPADDLAGNLLLVGLPLLLVAAVFALGAVSLGRGWKGRWALQAVIGLGVLVSAWFVVQ